MRLLLFVCFSALLYGCARTQINYTSYVGQQQDWAVATGAAVQRQFSLPVYQGPPERPYRVLGWIRVANARSVSRGLEYAVAEAVKRGADAVILLNQEPGGSSESTNKRGGSARVIAIKFQ